MLLLVTNYSILHLAELEGCNLKLARTLSECLALDQVECKAESRVCRGSEMTLTMYKVRKFLKGYYCRGSNLGPSRRSQVI
jgi:hypothetical protein